MEARTTSTAWTNSTCINPGVSGVGAVLFTSLLSTLMDSKRDFEDRSIYPTDPEYLLPEYDFIVVGAGSAGAVVASRLSEVPEWNVLLLEAGGDPTSTSDIPMLFFTSQHTDIDWQYRTEPDEGSCRAFKDHRCNWPRGKVLGGTSVLNGMIYMRGHKCDYDKWSADGNIGWSYEEVLPHFKKSEDLRVESVMNDDVSKAYHSTGGYLTVDDYGYDEELADAIIESGVEQGYKHLLDFNAKDVLGIGKVLGTIRNGTRLNTAKAFLVPVKDRKNLHVLKFAHVTKVLIDHNTKKTCGVEFSRKGSEMQVVKVSKEVIISAGAVSSPQILMLSGVGPRDHLEEIGVTPIIQDLKVGYNLHDHILFPGVALSLHKSRPLETHSTDILNASYEYLLHKKGPLSNTGVTTITAYIDTHLAPEATRAECPDVQVHYFLFPKNNSLGVDTFVNGLGLSSELQDGFHKMNQETEFLLPCPIVLNTKSRGQLRLKSLDPFDQPSISTGYFNNPADLETLVSGVEFVVKQGDTQAMSAHETELRQLPLKACDHLTFRTRDYWRCAVREMASTSYHPAGSCKMGPSTDPDSVVDPTLKVCGVHGLRVADASIMPTIVTGSPNGAIIMIGEKAADYIKSDWL